MEAFETQIRRVGNSYGVLVPKHVIDELGAKEGDTVEVALIPVREDRERAWRRLVGFAPHSPPFERERRDRF